MAKTTEDSIRAEQKKDPDDRVGHLLSLLDQERKAHTSTKGELAKATKEIVAKRGLKLNVRKHQEPKPVTRRM